MKENRLGIFKRIVILGTMTACAGSNSAVDSYTQQIKLDNAQRARDFTAAATTDLSGNGYEACVVSSDCLSGVQTCVAGTVPNTPQAPGYCVETSEE